MSNIEERKRTQSSSIMVFVVKTCIVAVIISACVIFIADWVIYSVRETIGPIGPVGGSQFWAKIERELDRAADPASDLPADKKQKLIHDVSVIVARWRPFVDAVQSELQKAPNESANSQPAR